MAAQTTRNLFLQVSANTDAMVNPLKVAKSALLNFGDAANDMQKEVQDAFQRLGDGGIANAGRQMDQSLQQQFLKLKANARAVMDAPTPQAAIGLINSAGADRDAATAETKAGAYRIAADAAAALAARTDEATREQLLLSAALEANAVAAEREAASLRATATMLGGVDAEIRATAIVSDEVAETVTNGHARMGASGMILQHVMRSTTDSFAAGLPVTMILGEQIGRLSEAAALAGDSMGSFGKFMGGPWGLAISAAISLTGTLASAMLGGAEAAKEDAKAHDALKDAVDRLNKASAVLNHTTALGIAEDIAKSEAMRQREIQTRRVLQAELELAQSKARDASKRSTDATQAGEGGFNPGAVAQGAAASEADDLGKQIAAQDVKIAAAVGTIRVGHGKLIARRVEEENDPKTAVRNRYDDRVDLYGKMHDRGRMSDVQYAAALTKAASDRDEGEEALKTHRQRKPRVDHTAQREANADRAYTAELQGAQSRYAKAQLALSDTAEAREKVEIDDLRAAKEARNREIDDQLKAGKFGKADTTEARAKALALKKLNDDTEALDETNAQRKEAQAILDRQLSIDRAALDGKMALLRYQAADAVGSGAKKTMALRLLAGEEDRARLDANRDLASDDPAVRAKGQASLDQIDAAHPYRVKEIGDQNRDPLQTYGEQLRGSVGDIGDAFKSVQADGLKGVEDGLLGVLSGTKSVSQGFREMASSIIADIERIAIEKLILSFIPGLSTGGKLPGLASGGLPGFAGGGDPFVDNGIIRGAGTGTSDSIMAVVGGKKPILLSNGEGIANARAVRNHWPLIDAMNKGTFQAFASGGLVDPSSIYMRALPNPKSVSPPAPPREIVYLQVDKSELFDTHVTRIAAPMAQAAMVGGSQQAQQDFSDMQAQRIPT